MQGNPESEIQEIFARRISGFQDSLSSIPDSKAHNSGFHKKKFPGCRIPQTKIPRFTDSGFPYMGRSITVLSSKRPRGLFHGEFFSLVAIRFHPGHQKLKSYTCS